ncbi:MAG: hypothetical protein ABL930_12210, partial [Pseudobdellovibrio sp.]
YMQSYGKSKALMPLSWRECGLRKVWVLESFHKDLECRDLLLLGRSIALKGRGDFMSGVVAFIRGVFEWGFWLLAHGLMKPAFLILIALAYDAYKTPRFSFSKFNRLLVGVPSVADAKLSAAKNSSSKRH